MYKECIINSFRLTWCNSEIAGMVNISVPEGGFFGFEDKAHINLEINSLLLMELLKYF